ncbi:MAG TPA: hypothetical protein VMT52_09080, partial [Planctomycetota bacterium]|nr:hypothetical protein [Planctomycetota bacterium]
LARRGAKSTIKDLTDAHDAYNQACFVMRRRMQREPALEKTFWKWVERLMTIKLRRGDTAGEVNQYREIVLFLEEQAKAGDMGGLKDRLLKISTEAAAKLEKAQGKSP